MTVPSCLQVLPPETQLGQPAQQQHLYCHLPKRAEHPMDAPILSRPPEWKRSVPPFKQSARTTKTAVALRDCSMRASRYVAVTSCCNLGKSPERAATLAGPSEETQPYYDTVTHRYSSDCTGLPMQHSLLQLQ